MTPGIEQVADRTWSLELGMHPHAFISSSVAYILKDDDARLHVLDPGWDVGNNWEHLLKAIGELGSIENVATVTASHMHIDHLGLASRLRLESGAAIVLARKEQEAIESFLLGRHEPLEACLEMWGVPPERHDEMTSVPRTDSAVNVTADLLVDDGYLLPVAGREVVVHVTPGHIPGSICLRDVAQSVLFTGDHVLPDYVPAPGLGGHTTSNPLSDFFASLERVGEFDDHQGLPGHGRPFRRIRDRCGVIVEHHLRRTRDVAEVRRQRPGASVWDIARGLHGVRGSSGFKGTTCFPRSVRSRCMPSIWKLKVDAAESSAWGGDSEGSAAFSGSAALGVLPTDVVDTFDG